MKYLGAGALVAIASAAACGGAQGPRRSAEGVIGGLARDHDSGVVVAKASIHVRREGELASSRTAVTGPKGTFSVDHLPPGRYSLTAEFAGQPIDVENIAVRADEIAIVDVMFTLGRPDPMHVDFGNPNEGAIDHYRPPHLAETSALIEGTVNEQGTHARVSGAVVTAYTNAGGRDALQTVTDAQGRFRFEAPPGTYSVSAYYTIGGRGEIEVRRSDIAVAGAEAVIVPLWIELAAQ